MRKYLLLLWTVIFLIPQITASADEVSDEVRAIQKMIQEKGLNWTAGQTSMMDLPLEERHQRLGTIIPEDIKALHEILDTLPTPLLTNIEDYFDWRVLGGVTPVDDQRDCGSCWAFSAGHAFESAYLIAEGEALDFSEQAVLSCNNPGHGCDGGYASTAYDLFIYDGAVAESCMPYHANDTDPCIMDQCNILANLQSYSNLPNNVNAIKNFIVSGPVVTTMRVYDDFFSYNGGCYEHSFTPPIDHGVVIVGWDDNMCDGEGAWIIKNSWNAGWGIDGYGYIKYGSSGIGSYSSIPIYANNGSPQIEYAPDSIYVNLDPDASTVRTIHLSNVGDGNLRFHIDVFTVSEMDSFGYYWCDNSSPEGPDYNWIDISGIGETVDFFGYDDNGNSGQLQLGFDFEYYGNTYDDLNICVNGWASFNNAFIMQWENEPIPDRELPNNMMAVFFDDLTLEHGGQVYFHTNEIDTAIITWDNVADVSQEGRFTFQVILAAPNSITYQYNAMGPNRLDECSIGIENRQGTVGTQVVCDGAYLYNDLAIQFPISDAPPSLDWISYEPEEGIIPMLDVQEIDITINSSDMPSGNYQVILAIMSTSSENPMVTIPVVLDLRTGIEKDNELVFPDNIKLNAAFPNPFNPEVTISYSIPKPDFITLEAYNLLGQRAATLYNGYQSAGEHSIVWHPKDKSSGVYLIKLSCGEQTKVAKVTMLK